MPLPLILGLAGRAIAGQMLADAVGTAVAGVRRDLGPALLGDEQQSAAAFSRLRDGRNYGVEALVPLLNERRVPLLPKEMTGRDWKQQPDMREAFKVFGPPRQGEGAEEYAHRVSALKGGIYSATRPSSTGFRFTVEGHNEARKRQLREVLARRSGR